MHWMLMPLRRYADFSGRSRRREYWMYTLGLLLLYLVLILLFVASVGTSIISGAASPESFGPSAGAFVAIAVVFVIAVFAFVIPSLAVSVRRLHDINLSGHWMWMSWAPSIAGAVFETFSPTISTILSIAGGVGGLALFVMAMLDGTKGPNRFGDDPKAGGMAEVFA